METQLFSPFSLQQITFMHIVGNEHYDHHKGNLCFSLSTRCKCLLVLIHIGAGASLHKSQYRLTCSTL